MIKQIPNFPGYLCDESGNCYSCFRYIRATDGKILDRVVDYSITPKLLKPQLVKEKYRSQIRPYLVLRREGKRHKIFISRLIATTFIPNPHNYSSVRHLNDISTQNNVENLLWGNNIHNIRDRERNQNKDLSIELLQEKLNKYITLYGEII